MSLSDTDVKKERLQAKPYKLSDSGGLPLGHACRRQALALVLWV
ncbi:hypothetical protein HDF16_001981 [Granulicella aggregans]|uniref:Uncharacterized protein n=1 Tax=Granulicella aggregans TaxID=474949 RepID=A0A7W7ZDD3_9BACT|nr:hypothetical protein [Granulicella aggregans]